MPISFISFNPLYAGRKPRMMAREQDGEGYVNGAISVKAWRKNAIEKLWGLDAVDVKGFEGVSSDEEEEEEEEEEKKKRGEEEEEDEEEAERRRNGVMAAATVENPARSSRRLLETLNGYYDNVAVKTYR